MKKTDTSAPKSKRVGIRAAVAVAAFALLGCTGVYAAERIDLFSGLFGSSDPALVDEYVAEAESVQDEGVYQAEQNGWLVSVEQFMYNEATDCGVAQFTVIDKTGGGRVWYNEAEWSEVYADWEKTEPKEIYTGSLGMMVMDDVNIYSNKLFAVKADENTTLCQMAFKCTENVDMKESRPCIVVFEHDGSDPKEIMRLDVPMGESLPSYCWRTDEGELRLMLSGMDYLFCDVAGDSDVILSEVSVQMKDGSSYVIFSDSQKILHYFYNVGTDDGHWSGFDRVIDLENVASFTVDGEVFSVEDAVLEYQQ